MCKTILTGRIGSIIFDQKSSTSFNFKCGSGQGDAVHRCRKLFRRREPIILEATSALAATSNAGGLGGRG